VPKSNVWVRMSLAFNHSSLPSCKRLPKKKSPSGLAKPRRPGRGSPLSVPERPRGIRKGRRSFLTQRQRNRKKNSPSPKSGVAATGKANRHTPAPNTPQVCTVPFLRASTAWCTGERTSRSNVLRSCASLSSRPRIFLSLTSHLSKARFATPHQYWRHTRYSLLPRQRQHPHPN